MVAAAAAIMGTALGDPGDADSNWRQRGSMELYEGLISWLVSLI